MGSSRIALAAGGLAIAALVPGLIAARTHAAAAAAPKFQWNGTTEYDYFGGAVAAAGDVNKDGTPDVLVGAPWQDPGGREDAGSVYVYSGKNGALLRQLDGAHAGDHYGYSVAGAGDVNGDGYADILVGARDEWLGAINRVGAAYVYSGKDGALLWQKHGVNEGDLYGWAVAGLGDVNKDGFADVAVTAPYMDPGGRPDAGSVFVLSGVDGSQLFRFDGEDTFNPSDNLGISVAAAMDVNKDTYPDIIVGVPHWDPRNEYNAGGAWLFSGKDGTVLKKWEGVHYLDYTGWSVAGVGDVNGDGFPDLAVGATVLHAGDPNKFYSWKTYGGFYIFSGADYSQLLRVVAPEEYTYLGNTASWVGDVNRDGKADVLIGAPNSNPGGVYNGGTAYVYSGTGQVLQRYDGVNRGDLVGWAVAGLGDINADGLGDLVVGTPNLAVSGALRAGSVAVYGSTSGCGAIAVAFDERGQVANVELGVLAAPLAVLALALTRRRRASHAVG